MDLVIKNLEKLRDYHSNDGKHPIETLVLDFGKLSETEDFTKIFEKSCEKYVEAGESYLVPNEDIKEAMEAGRSCVNCKNSEVSITQEPCRSCWTSMKILKNFKWNAPNWEPKEPRLKDKAVLTYDNKPDYDSMTEDAVLYDEEAEKSYLKTVTERMKSEFDATGKDVRYFMENKIKHKEE